MFVGNLPEDTDASWLAGAFSHLSKVKDAFFPCSSKKGSRSCFGFVRFRDRRLVLKSIATLNGSSLKGRRLLVKMASFSWSQRRISKIQSSKLHVVSSDRNNVMAIFLLLRWVRAIKGHIQKLLKEHTSNLL